MLLAGQWAVGREGQSRIVSYLISLACSQNLSFSCPLEQSKGRSPVRGEEGQQNDEDGLSGIKNGP